MTKLIVKPLDMSEKGSYAARRKLLELLAVSDKELTPQELARMLIKRDDLILARCHTDDGRPVEEVLAELTGDQFEELIAALTPETIPNPSAAS